MFVKVPRLIRVLLFQSLSRHLSGGHTPKKTRSYEAKVKAYADDALVWRQSVRKVYAEHPGVTIMLTGEVAA